MKKFLNVFYASGVSEKDAKKFCKLHGVDVSVHQLGYPLTFLEFPHTEGQELNAVLSIADVGVNVYVMQLSHLGQGAKAKEMREAIEAKGAKIIVPERKLQKRGPKPKHGLTSEQIEFYRADYDTKTVTRQFVINKILRDTGVQLTRHTLRNIFKK